MKKIVISLEDISYMEKSDFQIRKKGSVTNF